MLPRWQFLLGAAAAGMSLAGAIIPARAEDPATEPDYRLSMTPVSLELAPGRVIQTFGYNGTAPGPVLRLPEGRQVHFEIRNETDIDDIVHWHGLYLPSEVDGSMEEGTPIVPRGAARGYTFTPKPPGIRWYHSHNFAGKDLSRITYSGMFGFLIAEPTHDPGRYDREVLLAAHHWEGSWVSTQDVRKGPPPDYGLEVMYAAAPLNDRLLGHGEPVRVREGEHVLFRLLNASATENIRLALPGHRLTVLALDGNPVHTPQAVDVLSLAVAERADVIVEMNGPSVWILGEVDDDVRNMGLGVVVEYANQRGDPQWSVPRKARWDYTAFGREGRTPEPDECIELTFEKILGGRGGYNRWTTNSKSWPDTNPLFTIEQGKRYRLAMNNNSGDAHPVYTHRHTFEVVKVGDKTTAGVMKDTLNLPRFATAEIDLIADDPGATLFHCHHQDHQDEGFMGLINYA
jgi:FtsP/CotA-like multicopper oxidase with cupredoxin domain